MILAIIGVSSDKASLLASELIARHHDIVCAWDYKHSKADRFCNKFGGRPIDDIERIADEGLDGVIILSHPPDSIKHTLPFVAGGVPVLLDCLCATIPKVRERLSEAVREHGTPVIPLDFSNLEKNLTVFLAICSGTDVLESLPLG